MDPTSNYHKTKRILLVFVAALLLAIFAGLQLTNEHPPNEPSRVSVPTLQLKHPEFLKYILVVAVGFYLVQFSLQWAAQITEVQKNTFHRWDFIIIAATAAFSIFCFGGKFADDSYFHVLNTFWVTLMAIFVAGFLGLAVGVLVEKASTNIGDRVKDNEAQEDEQVMTVLKNKTWVLNYNSTKPGRGKEITFEDEDRIGAGLSDRIHSWRVTNGLLEIINNQGRVYSRFSYDPETKAFVHTNDPDTISTKSQSIRLKPSPPPVLGSPMTTS